MPEFETIKVETRSVGCDGGSAGLGHPRVFLNLGPAGRIECPYCSRVFIYEAPGHHDEAATAVAHPPPGA